MNPPIYHLDLKPANILLDNNMVPKIADFGLSRFITEEKTMITKNLVGTLPYMPREYIERKEISNKLDIFSLGAVMLDIIAGPTGRFRSTKMPSLEFTNQVQGKWKNRLQTRRNGPLLEAYCQQVKTCTEIALKCLEIDRENRPNILEIINQINEKEDIIGEKTKNLITIMNHVPKRKRRTKRKIRSSQWSILIFQEMCIHQSHVTAAKFIARKQWFVVGHQDGFIRVYTYESPVKQVKRFKAHVWNITTLDVHPTEPYLLSVGSQDQIKLWDWNKGWECIKTFDLHGIAYQIKFNPKDTHKFAIASLQDAQVWNIRSSRHEFTLSGHGYIVSCLDYFTRGNQLYMITGSWDKTAKIWDCQRRTCVQTLEGHTDCITCVCSHPDLPVLLTGSNDETVRLWNSITFKLEGVLDFELGQVTAIICLKGSKRVVIGHDAGLVITEIRHERPAAWHLVVVMSSVSECAPRMGTRSTLTTKAPTGAWLTATWTHPPGAAQRSSTASAVGRKRNRASSWSSLKAVRAMNPTNVTYELLEEITDGFSEERKLGEGGYGTVYKGEHKNGDKIAVKILHDTQDFDGKKLQNEFGNLMIVNHPNIVQLVGYCYEIKHTHGQVKGRPVLVATIHRALCFEYMPRGSLENYLSDKVDGLDWPIRYKIIKGTCEGLKHLHVEMKPPIYHLDLKPANILLDNNMVPKIADFGLSRFITEDKTMTTKTLVGTITYLPREYIERKEISNKLDIFSLGVVMLEIIAGPGPTGRFRSTEIPSQEFTDQVLGNWKTRLETGRNGSLLEAYCQQVKTCTEIALKCMETDRENRPNIVEIINQINEKEAIIGELPIDHALEKLPSHNNESVTLESKLPSHLNLNETKENHEADHHNSSCSKEKEEDREEDQIIPMEHPDVPIDVHPSEPWILTSNMFGSVDILNYNTLFIARKQWFVVGHHDGFIRVYTYESPVKQVKRFKAHAWSWTITTLDVHPTEPYLLSVGSQDQIKLWDWNKDWECIRTFDPHGVAYQIKFNPKDTHKFAVASLMDAQVWNIRSSRHEFTLSGHVSIVDCFDFFTRGNQLYMITGSWDKTAKIWDCQRRTCVQTLEGHTDCITCVCSHPDLPILLTGSNDETVRLWNATTFKLEGVLDFELGKVTAIVCLKGSKRVAIGHDAGLVITEIRHGKPAPSNR
uniref:Beta'-coat protein n=1 Tax=Oryza nivara TaxID=4536 RepID=A0A0E0IZK9_ORYNI